MVKKLFLVALLAAPFLLCPTAHAQFIGYVSPQTVTQTIFTNQTSAATVVVANLGQNVHFLSYTLTGCTNCPFQLRMEGSLTGASFFPISDDAFGLLANGPSAGQIYAIGYYPIVRVNLVVNAGVTLSAGYAGTSATSGSPLGSYNPTGQIRKVCFANASAGSVQSCILTLPYGNTGGVAYLVNPTGAGGIPANSTLQFLAEIGGTVTALSSTSFSLSTSTFQIFNFPPTVADNLAINYTNGGASTATISLEFIFTNPGQQGGLSVASTSNVATCPNTANIGSFIACSPAQLGANAITLPASGTTALTNIIDTRGVKGASIVSNCGQNYSVNLTTYMEDGTTVAVSAVQLVSTGAAETGGNTDIQTIGSESAVGGINSNGSKGQSIPVKFPQRAIAFSWTNTTATASTCTARLFLAY